MEAVLKQTPGFNLLEDLGRLIGRVFRLQVGGGSGVTKTGKPTGPLSRKVIQALGGGNWAKGKGMLNKGTATTAQINAAKKSVAKPSSKPAGKMAARLTNATKPSKPSVTPKPKTPAQRAVDTRNMNEARRVVAGRPSRPAQEKRELDRTRREILRGQTGSFNNQPISMRSGRDRNGNLI